MSNVQLQGYFVLQGGLSYSTPNKYCIVASCNTRYKYVVRIKWVFF